MRTEWNRSFESKNNRLKANVWVIPQIKGLINQTINGGIKIKGSSNLPLPLFYSFYNILRKGCNSRANHIGAFNFGNIHLNAFMTHLV